MTFFNTIKQKLQKLNSKMDDCQEAITFAQAGVEHSLSQDETMTCKQKTKQNLVVASHNNRFSDKMVDYALEMAKRMNYGIIAVNAANLTHDVTEFFSATHDELYNDFKQTSLQNVVSFQEKASALGLKFAHVTKFSDIDHAIEDITKECGTIEFIISENREPTRARGVTEKEQRIAQQLCVYSIN